MSLTNKVFSKWSSNFSIYKIIENYYPLVSHSSTLNVWFHLYLLQQHCILRLYLLDQIFQLSFYIYFKIFWVQIDFTIIKQSVSFQEIDWFYLLLKVHISTFWNIYLAWIYNLSSKNLFHLLLYHNYIFSLSIHKVSVNLKCDLKS